MCFVLGIRNSPPSDDGAEALYWGLSPSQAVLDAILAVGFASLFASVTFPVLVSPDAAFNQTCDIAFGFSFEPLFASRVYGGCQAEN